MTNFHKIQMFLARSYYSILKTPKDSTESFAQKVWHFVGVKALLVLKTIKRS